MRIALDGAGLSPRMTGVGRYFQSLLQELIPLDPSIAYTLFLKDDFDTTLKFPNLTPLVLPQSGSYFLWQNTLLRNAVRKGRFDLFWSANYTLPIFLPVPAIVTVHDISWKTLTKDYSPAIRMFRSLTGSHSMKKAKLVFTVSDFSRAEIIRLAAVPAGKVVRVHEGVTDRFQRVTADQVIAFKERYGISAKRVVGFLGSFFKRRHVAEVIAAMAIARRRYPDLVLFLVGANHSVPPGLLNNDPGNVIWRQRLPESEINAFYSSLSLFLYPSAYEGFGLPPMEALNCGTPSLLLRQSSLAEIYEDLALFIDQPDPALIAAAVCGFLQQEEETRRQLLKSWQNRKPYFSWKRAAEEHLREIWKLR